MERKGGNLRRESLSECMQGWVLISVGVLMCVYMCTHIRDPSNLCSVFYAFCCSHAGHRFEYPSAMQNSSRQG